MISYYGGQILNEISELCTHAFALNYDQTCQKFEDDQKQVKLVTPDWLIDCIKKEELVEADNFNPKYLTSDPKNLELLAELESKEKEKAEKVN